jgi:outer membrane receptor protein involved in Fe transport
MKFHIRAPNGLHPFRSLLVTQAITLALTGRAALAADNPAPTTPPPATPEQSVIVSAQKLQVETLVDRKIYSVAADVQASFGSVGDILTAIPSVDVDGAGAVSLRGDTNVLILIDGKPSALFSGSKAGDNLQSIPAKDIERIEVLPTPPAQFKADGAAGVINIITRKKRPEGFAGSVQGSLGNRSRAFAGADTSYHSGPLNASASAGFRHDFRERSLGSDVRVAGTPTTPPVEEVSTLNERAHRAIPTAATRVDYEIDDQQSVSGSLNWMKRGGPRTYTQINTSSTNGSLLSSEQRLSTGHDPETEYDERLGYTRKLARPGEMLELTAHRSTARQRERYDYTNDSFVPPAPTVLNSLNLLEDHTTTEAGADYTLPISRAHTLKLGYSYEQNDFHYANGGANTDLVTGVETPEPNITNNFKFRQKINAGYLSYQATTENWSVLAGLRAEQAQTDALLLTTDARNTDDYFRVYPSLHINRALSDQSTLSFGASRRVSRPDPSDLDPYLDTEYTPNLRTGNPNLRPQYTQSYEIGYGYEGGHLAYQVTGYYRRNRDSVTDVTQYQGNGVSLTTRTNLPKNNAAGFEITSNGRLLPQLSYSISANPFDSQIDATTLGEPGLKSTTGINAKLKLDYQPTPSDSAQIAFTRSDKRLTPQGYVLATNIVNFGYKHQARTDLTAVFTVSDIFNGQRNRRLLTTPAFSGEYGRTVYGRLTYIGLIYSFGSAKTDKQFDYDQSG